jgi:hypothetical protein
MLRVRERVELGLEVLLLTLLGALLLFGPLATGCVRPRDFAVVEFLTALCMLVWLGMLWLDSLP